MQTKRSHLHLKSEAGTNLQPTSRSVAQKKESKNRCKEYSVIISRINAECSQQRPKTHDKCLTLAACFLHIYLALSISPIKPGRTWASGVAVLEEGLNDGPEAVVLDLAESPPSKPALRCGAPSAGTLFGALSKANLNNKTPILSLPPLFMQRQCCKHKLVALRPGSLPKVGAAAKSLHCRAGIFSVGCLQARTDGWDRFSPRRYLHVSCNSLCLSLSLPLSNSDPTERICGN